MSGVLGRQISAAVLQKGIRELNSDVTFDLAGRHGVWHPRIEELQSVYYKEKHLGSMDRDTDECMVPEVAVYYTADEWDDEEGKLVKKIQKVLKIGWRPLFNKLAGSDIPGITYETLCEKFDVPVSPPEHFSGMNTIGKYDGENDDLTVGNSE